jgi:hypothetical protein
MDHASTEARPAPLPNVDDEVCAWFHRWEQRCFAMIKFLGALALLVLLIILKAGLVTKTIHVEFGDSPWGTAAHLHGPVQEPATAAGVSKKHSCSCQKKK